MLAPRLFSHQICAHNSYYYRQENYVEFGLQVQYKRKHKSMLDKLLDFITVISSGDMRETTLSSKT